MPKVLSGRGNPVCASLGSAKSNLLTIYGSPASSLSEGTGSSSSHSVEDDFVPVRVSNLEIGTIARPKQRSPNTSLYISYIYKQGC